MNVLTPTTKEAEHDRPISGEEVVSSGLMTQEDCVKTAAAELSLFEYGQKVADEHGLLLVDTKYEFGKVDPVIIL